MSNDKNDKKDTQDALNKVISDAVERGIEKGLPAAAAMAVQAANRAQPQPSHVVRAAGGLKDFGERCHICGQFRVGCQDKHVEMIVAPRNPRRYNSFPGVFINGVQYLSPSPTTPILVPDGTDILNRIHVWEEAEEDLRNGRVIEHDSGRLSGKPGGVNVTNAYAGAGFRG